MPPFQLNSDSCALPSDHSNVEFRVENSEKGEKGSLYARSELYTRVALFTRPKPVVLLANFYRTGPGPDVPAAMP